MTTPYAAPSPPASPASSAGSAARSGPPRLAGRYLRPGLVAAVVLAATVLAAPSAQAAAGSDHLDKGERLSAGQSLVRYTVNRTRVELVMQTDGNLVLYNDGLAGQPRRACWASGTKGNGYYATYQSDGNFVVYNRSNQPTWASHTQRDGGTTTNINAYGQLWAGYTDISGYCQ